MVGPPIPLAQRGTRVLRPQLHRTHRADRTLLHHTHSSLPHGPGRPRLRHSPLRRTARGQRPTLLLPPRGRSDRHRRRRVRLRPLERPECPITTRYVTMRSTPWRPRAVNAVVHGSSPGHTRTDPETPATRERLSGARCRLSTDTGPAANGRTSARRRAIGPADGRPCRLRSFRRSTPQRRRPALHTTCALSGFRRPQRRRSAYGDRRILGRPARTGLPARSGRDRELRRQRYVNRVDPLHPHARPCSENRRRTRADRGRSRIGAVGSAFTRPVFFVLRRRRNGRPRRRPRSAPSARVGEKAR
mgnify:CR=1 FL=1